MSQPRAVDLNDGTAMVITDLHGRGEIYQRLRDHFMALYHRGEVQHLIICGDMLHGYSDSADDQSLPMLLDFMELQEQLGPDRVIMLLGNHELPHIYGITLAKGDQEFTPSFEHELNQLDAYSDGCYSREDVYAFLRSLPFFVRTRAGVLLTHAGASPVLQTTEAADLLLHYDHEAVLQQADGWLNEEYNLAKLRANDDYRQLAARYLAVDDTDDPRYAHLLRGQVITQNSGAFTMLWELLFARNELESDLGAYQAVVEKFLEAISAVSPYEQRVLVAGHLPVSGGHAVVTERQLRLATYAHAYPNDAGQYLLLGCGATYHSAAQLVPHLRDLPG